VSDCCLTPIHQFSAISWREQVNFQWNDDEVRLVLAHWNNSLRVNMSLHSETLLWFPLMQTKCTRYNIMW